MLQDLPEPIAARFQRLPLEMRMRLAADVMHEVNERYRRENPRAGFSPNEPISESSMRGLADLWQRAACSNQLVQDRTVCNAGAICEFDGCQGECDRCGYGDCELPEGSCPSCQGIV
jgi:hypothetical protein